MQQQPAQTVSRKLTFLFKGAYWVSLLIIAGMVMASFALLHQIMAAQQHDRALRDIVSRQQTLSQRIVFLAAATDKADRGEQPALLAALLSAITQFETNYDLLLDKADIEDEPRALPASPSVRKVLFSKPFHLDYFTIGLAANGRRLASAIDMRLNTANTGKEPKLGGVDFSLDASIANATLSGYAALAERIGADTQMKSRSLVDLHRRLFYATIGVIVLVTLFIFRPMSNLILRKTDELVEARNSMAFLAAHDGLTGLHNRTFLADQFETQIRTARRRNERLAVVQIDLDRFKQINDTLGHAAGDHVLVIIAQRMRDACRACDLCLRLGGDEFVLIVTDAGATDQIDLIARRVLTQINLPIVFHGATILPAASAGVAIYPADADNAQDLLVHADLALYSTKKRGGGAVRFFSGQLRLELDHFKRLEHDIRLAISNRAFDVHFQPQVSLSDGGIKGMEALVRWNHPVRGMVSPGEFIPLAERCGLMPKIGRIAIDKAIDKAAEWHRAGIAFGRLAINVSGSELREPDFEAFLFGTLEAAGLPPFHLSLEIVESVILDDEKTGIAARLRHIRSAGINLELDDFGTGYASLTHVNPTEIDRLKIDRRFVQDIDRNSHNAKIVRAIIELGRGLGISIVAEGAETEAELALLRKIGCDQIQGYSIARPMPHEEARDWLVARAGRNARIRLVSGPA